MFDISSLLLHNPGTILWGQGDPRGQVNEVNAPDALHVLRNLPACDGTLTLQVWSPFKWPEIGTLAPRLAGVWAFFILSCHICVHSQSFTVSETKKGIWK